jgi:hypothetical protein
MWSASPSAVGGEPQAWRAGTASVVITPDEPMWMAGYAARDKPSEGKVHDLYAKALALEDAEGTRLVIVGLDLIGTPRPLRDRLAAEVGTRFGLPPEGLLLNASHTHCGPELRMSKASLYDLPQERVEQARQYCGLLEEKLLGLIDQAIDGLAPASLAYTHARAGFAMNRRLPTEQGFQNRPNPDGPVDHDVPVLRVDRADAALAAVVFGYACHATTLSFYEFCGDWPGFAQAYVEEAHPGTTALFVAGCGADQNPQPRRTLDLARQHGRALANGVEAALISRARPVRGPLRLALGEVPLPFAEPPGRQELEAQAKSKNQHEKRHAEVLLQELEETGKLRASYPCLVQIARFGNDLTLAALAGEVVVGYSLRFKEELAGPPVWVAGYSNDVFGYLPTSQVVREGGYEGGGAMRYTTLPGPFVPEVEEAVVEKVHELFRKTATEN